jgi:uncharacterized protein YndB with AHSA1/START domain
MNFVQSVNIKTTPELAFAAIATQDGLSKWYTPDTTASDVVGGSIEFGFGAGGTLGFRVEHLEAGKRVEWSVTQASPEWMGTRVSFDIVPTRKGIELRFSHSGIPADYPYYSCFSYLWAQHIRSLKMLLETGTGEPVGSPGCTSARSNRIFPTPTAGQKNSDIVHSVGVDARSERLLSALTTDKGLAAWYAPATHADARVGGTIVFTFATATLRFRIEELGPSCVVWSVMEAVPGWTGSRITFEIVPTDDGVNLTFRQTGLPEDYAQYGSFNYLWAQYVRSLKLSVETGTGEPFGSPESLAAGTSS